MSILPESRSSIAGPGPSTLAAAASNSLLYSNIGGITPNSNVQSGGGSSGSSSKLKLKPKRRSNFVIEIPYKPRKGHLKDTTPISPVGTQYSNGSGSGTAKVIVVPSKSEYPVLQEDLICPWHKCDARLANIHTAKKHYAIHQSKVQGLICGIRKCTHPLQDTERSTLERHFYHYHLTSYKPNVKHEPFSKTGAKPRPPASKFLEPLPPLPTDVAPYYLTTAPVQPTYPTIPKSANSPIKLLINPALLPLEIRQQRARSNGKSPQQQAQPKHPIHPDYGDSPFIPIQGDAIVEAVRYSSYIFPHPAEYTNNPGENERIQEWSAIPPSSIASTMPTITFPMIDGSRSASASSSRTAVSHPESRDVDPLSTIPLPSKDITSENGKIPFAIIPDDATGRLPLTIPLADVFAEAKRRQPVNDPPKPSIALNSGMQGHKRKAEARAMLAEKIRRVAGNEATRVVGKTVGVEWWETMFEVEQSLKEAMAEGQTPG